MILSQYQNLIYIQISRNLRKLTFILYDTILLIGLLEFANYSNNVKKQHKLLNATAQQRTLYMIMQEIRSATTTTEATTNVSARNIVEDMLFISNMHNTSTHIELHTENVTADGNATLALKYLRA